MFQQHLFSWGLLELPIPLALKRRVAHHNILVIILWVLPVLHLSGSAAGKGYKCPLHCGFSPSLKHSINLPSLSEIFFPPFLLGLQQLCLHNYTHKYNSLKGKFQFSWILPQPWNSLGGPEITLLKSRGQTNYNFLLLFSLNQHSRNPHATKCPPHASAPLWKILSRRHALVFINMLIYHLRNHTALCEEGNRDFGKDLDICVQKQRLHGQKNLLFQNWVTGWTSWKMPVLKRFDQ